MRLSYLFAGAAVLAMTGYAHAEGDAAKGEAVFKQCKVCHMVGPTAKNNVGPILNGVVGRKSGTAEGFKYSQAMIDKGVTWTPETIDAYLTDPKAYVPGNKMLFVGLKKPEDRADVIAYLKTFDK
jgi:cytochrome c